MMSVRMFTAVALFSLAAASGSTHGQTATPKQLQCEDITAPAEVTFAQPPKWQTTDALPKYCQVRGRIADRIRFEMRLPEDWNGRFMMAGCGGFCGELLPDKSGHSNAINEALKRGYAAISHDAGHQAKSWQVNWAYEDAEALEIWAHKVIPMVRNLGVELVNAVYQQAPNYSYFSGCSNGGRLGLIAAQRYPQLFDGIAAGGPILNLSETAGLWGNWVLQHAAAADAPLLTAVEVEWLKNQVLQQCDGHDDQTDGIISAPQQCHFDFSSLQCTSEQEPSNCLSAEQTNMLTTLYSGVKNAKGEVVAGSMEFGSEHYADIWIFGTPERPAWGAAASQGYRQLLSMELFERETANAVSTQTMLDWLDQAALPQLTDAVEPTLAGLQQHATKLMIYQGWADPLIIPQPVIDYYQQALASTDDNEALQEHARLFMLPGWGHCWERPAEAPDQFDPLQVLEQWVEQDQAPDAFIATQKHGETVVRSRPICAYPKVAQLQVDSDPNLASSYQCVSPEGTSQATTDHK